MSEAAGSEVPARACACCLRRSWLLAELSVPLDYLCRDRGRLIDALSLDDEELLASLAGRRRGELARALAGFQPAALASAAGVDVLCRHDPCYPTLLGGRAAPHALFLAGGASRLAELSARPVVAITGSTRASDYGVEMARSLARGLTASGVTVVSMLADGVAASAQEGAREACGAGAIAVTGQGLDLAPAGRWRELRAHLAKTGCAIAELPCGCRGRLFGDIAAERIVAELGCMLLVVEASASAGDLAPAARARALGRLIAAVPGRVTSPLSDGANGLLNEGAALVRDTEDVLELLAAGGAASQFQRAPSTHPPDAALTPLHHTLLQHVGAGRDSAERLAQEDLDPGELLLALSELELMGLLVRGDGGRYLACGDRRRGQS